MREKIHQKVSVASYYSARRGASLPYMVRWKNRDYKVGEVGSTHKYKHGDTWHHIFDFVDDNETLHFRLNFNTKELSWSLEVIDDGLPS